MKNSFAMENGSPRAAKRDVIGKKTLSKVYSKNSSVALCNKFSPLLFHRFVSPLKWYSMLDISMVSILLFVNIYFCKPQTIFKDVHRHESNTLLAGYFLVKSPGTEFRATSSMRQKNVETFAKWYNQECLMDLNETSFA